MAAKSNSLWKYTLIRLRRNYLAIFGFVVLLILIFVAIFAEQVAPFGYAEQDYMMIRKPPSEAHLLGTDEFGRDILSRLIFGSRVSLQVGLVAVSISLFAGGAIGAIAGYYGGRIDNILMRIMDVQLAIPTILLAIDTEEVQAEIAKAPELFVILAVRLDQAGIPSVLCDDNHGIRTLMEHLKHRGHKRIALFHSHNGLPLEEVQGAVWKTCLGTNYSPELNICANVCAEKEPMDSAYEAMLTAAAAVDFSAVLCLNDEIMLGGMAALRKLGRDIPKDVSVVSVGNTHLSRYAHPPVTCYDPNLEEHLNQAIMLLDYNYGNPDNLDKLRLVNPVLIERDSVTKQSE